MAFWYQIYDNISLLRSRVIPLQSKKMQDKDKNFQCLLI